MKNLSAFNMFDYTSFMAKKTLVYLNVSEWIDPQSGQSCGVKVGTLITRDDTVYKNDTNNLGEKLVVKVPNKSVGEYQKNFKPMTTEVVLKDVKDCRVYGEFRNMLTITGDIVKADGK